MKIDGNGNIVIQDVKDSTISVNVNDTGRIEELLNSLDEKMAAQLKQLIEEFKKNQEKVINQNAGNIYNIDNANFIKRDEQKYPQKLTSLPLIDPDKLIGREDELVLLNKMLFGEKKVIITGLGGIGKTTLAQAYISQYIKDYKHIAWISQNGDSAEEAFLEDMDLLDNLQIDISQIAEKDRLRVILNKQRTIDEKPNLLVIDNTDCTICKFCKDIPGKPNWHVLITSREKIENFEPLKIGFLSHEEAINLFKMHCKKITNENDISLLLQAVDYHTLTIEILAKTAELQRTSIETLRLAIQKDLKANVPIKHANDKKINNITKYLKSIFSISGLNQNQEWLMKLFCFLPPDFHSYELLSEIIPVEKLEWADDFSETIDELSKKGWLLENKETDSYKMHRIVSQVVFDHLNPKLEDIEIYIKNVSELLYVVEDIDDFVPKQKWIPFANAILDTINKFNIEKNEDILNLKKNLGWMYYEFRKDKSAKNIFESALSLSIKKFGLKNAFVADCQSKLGEMLRTIGETELALELSKQAVQTDDEILEKGHPNIALHQNNLALIYDDIGDHEKAKDLLEKAISSDKEVLGENHPIIARYLNNLANAYSGLNEENKALELLTKAVKIFIDSFGENHPRVPLCQINLSGAYFRIGNYDKALSLAEKALELDLRNFRENHPKVIENQDVLAGMYLNLGNIDKGLILLNKSLKSCIENLGEKHENVLERKTVLYSIYEQLKENQKASELLQQIIEITSEKNGEEDPGVILIQQKLATLYYELENYLESEKLLRKIINIKSNTSNPDQKLILNLKIKLLDSVVMGRNIATFDELFDEIKNQESLEKEQLQYIRLIAFNLYKTSEYNLSETTLNFLVENNFEISSTYCHLARIYIIQDRFEEAENIIIKASENNSDTHNYIIMRVLFFQILFSMIKNTKLDKLVSQLKTIMTEDNYRMDWDIQDMLNHLEKKLEKDQILFLRALSAAINKYEELEKLNDFQLWVQAET